MSSPAQLLSIIEPRAVVKIAEDYPNPAESASSEDLKASLWHGAAIVTIAVSSIFVCGAIFGGFVVPFSPLFFLLLLGGPYTIGTVGSGLMERSYEHETASYNFTQVQKKLQTFENFTRGQIWNLLYQHGINPFLLRVDCTSKEFKILLAHFLLYTDRIASVQNALANASYPIPVSASSSDDHVLKYYSHRAYLREWGEYADKIRAACLIERMYVPAKKIELREIGQMTPKPFDKRSASQTMMGSDSPYFVFNDSNRLSITPAQMAHTTPSLLHQRLFYRV